MARPHLDNHGGHRTKHVSEKLTAKPILWKAKIEKRAGLPCSGE